MKDHKKLRSGLLKRLVAAAAALLCILRWDIIECEAIAAMPKEQK